MRNSNKCAEQTIAISIAMETVNLELEGLYSIVRNLTIVAVYSVTGAYA